MSYLITIEVAVFSSKKKAEILSRDRNFNPIAIKLGLHVGLIKIQFEFLNLPCGANRRERTSLPTSLEVIFLIRLSPNW